MIECLIAMITIILYQLKLSTASIYAILIDIIIMIATADITYVVPKSLEVANRGQNDYLKSTDNFSYNASNDSTSNEHYEYHDSNASTKYWKTTPYKIGALIYYVPGSNSWDWISNSQTWIKNDISKTTPGTMEEGILRVGNTALFTTQHTVTQADIDAGNLLTNNVTVTASLFVQNESDPDQEPLEVIITESIDSPIETNLNSISELEVTKQADVDDKNGDGYTNSGDKVTYTIDITNSGTQTITGLEIEDTLSDLDGNLISNPDLSQLTINTNYVYHTDDLWNNLKRSYGANTSTVGLQFEPPNNISIYVDPDNNHNERGAA